MTEPTRPVLRYHGGKWRLAPWIIGFFPPHRVYVEPFGGGGSVLMRKAPTYAEVYNDLDGEVVNVFRVLRDPAGAAALERGLRLTPFARTEFFDAYTTEGEADPVERARHTIIKSFMGYGSDALRDATPRGMRTRASTHPLTTPTGFRSNSSRSHTTPAHDWANYPDQIGRFLERLQRVVIENSDAALVMRTHDRPETLHYCDPPYVHATRRPLKKGTGGGYRHELTDADHVALADVLRSLDGMVVLSGYPCALYDRDLYPDRERHERVHLADGARRRTEVVWLNPACAAALRAARDQHSLLDGVPA